MKAILRFAVPLVLLLTPSLHAEDKPEPGIPPSLMNYVNRPEPAFRWDVKETTETDSGRIHRLHLVSQTWHDVVWEHVLMVYEPKQVDHPRHALLFVTGGSNGRTPGKDDLQTGLQLAQLCGARVAMLYQVPNQPLFDGRKEDDLITETWLKYLDTGDDTWPLLFPMVKSAVKAMDAVEQFAESQGAGKVEGFVITGASKRGWTSWLTPVAEKRVIATAPIVIDTLNFPKQMKYQLDTWGKYSEQIDDYTRKGLVRPSGEPETPRERTLWLMMDPYTYRKQLTLPKLLINGTNDRYWVVDAMKNYWDDLSGPKYILFVPNAGHGLDGGRELALSTVAAFFRHAADGAPLPALDWKFANGGKRLSLSIASDTQPLAVRLWQAASESKDFRESRWTSAEINSAEPKRYVVEIDKPATGHVALYGELQFERQGVKYSLTTRVFRE